MNTKDYFKQNTGKPKGKEFWQGYYSNVPRVKYVLEENEKLALREVGKFQRKEIKKNIRALFKKRSGNLLKSVGSKIDKKTKSIRTGIFGNRKMRGRAFYSKFLELGTSKRRKTPFIEPATSQNIPKIRSIIADKMGNVTKDKVVPVKTDEVVFEDQG